MSIPEPATKYSTSSASAAETTFVSDQVYPLSALSMSIYLKLKEDKRVSVPFYNIDVKEFLVLHITDHTR